MNKVKYSSLLLAQVFCFAATTSYGATFSIGAGSFAELKDAGGSTLANSSIVQLGYFSGVSDAKDPTTYSLADWASFAPISGIGSLNPGKTSAIDGTLGVGTFDTSINYNTATDVLPGTNGGPGAYNVRLGIRIFDSTTTTTGSNYNTVTVFNSTWLFTTPPSNDDPYDAPSPVIGTVSDLNMSWEDGGVNAGLTSLTLVPEPSSLALLGLGATALLFRRRK